VTQEYKTTYATIAVVVSVLALSFGDAIIKLTGLSLPLWQMYILRSVFALPVLGLLLLKRPRVSNGSFLWIMIRSLLLVLMWICYYSSLPLVSLSVAAAAYYTAPIFIAVLATLVSRKKLPLRIWLSLIVGFIGVLLILRPDGSEFRVATLLPLLAAILYASAMVLTSFKCRNDDPIKLSIALNVAFVICGILLGMFSGSSDSFLFGSWRPINLRLLGIVVILSASIVIGSVGAAIAYQNGPPTKIAAFDYSYLIFSLCWGVLFFAEIPSFVSLIGIAVIALAGYFVISTNYKSTLS